MINQLLRQLALWNLEAVDNDVEARTQFLSGTKPHAKVSHHSPSGVITAIIGDEVCDRLKGDVDDCPVEAHCGCRIEVDKRGQSATDWIKSWKPGDIYLWERGGSFIISGHGAILGYEYPEGDQHARLT